MVPLVLLASQEFLGFLIKLVTAESSSVTVAGSRAYTVYELDGMPLSVMHVDVYFYA